MGERRTEFHERFSCGRANAARRFCRAAATLAFVLSVVGALGCKPKKFDCFAYFNDFEFRAASEPVLALNLGEGVSVASYDAREDLFVTVRGALGGTGLSYGLASSSEEYFPPMYREILSIAGDYALVVRGPKPGEYSAMFLDLIRFRGVDRQIVSLLADRSVPYVEDKPCLMLFDAFLACRGNLDEPDAGAYETAFYDYKTGFEPLEAFRVRKCFDGAESYEFLSAESYLVAYTNRSAYFYDVADPLLKGYLEPVTNGEYKPFERLDEESGFERELEVRYLGNGWFMRSNRLSKNMPFAGFNVLLEDAEEEGMPKYVRADADFFNARTGVSKRIDRIFSVENVANEFSHSYFDVRSYELNNGVRADPESGAFAYDLPFANPSNMIKPGYSVVYYHYQPYRDEIADDEKHENCLGVVTHCILDRDLNLAHLPDALMPIAYIDGFGVQNSDPEYTDTFGSACVYDRRMRASTLAPFERGRAEYNAFYANGECCVVCRRTVEPSVAPGSPDGVRRVEKYGAFDARGRRIADFKYDELTFFSGGSAIGSISDSDGKKRYFRLGAADGSEEELTDVVAVRQRMYVFSAGSQQGLKAYDGTILIPANYVRISLCESAMTSDGKALLQYAVCSDGKSTKLYRFG